MGSRSSTNRADRATVIVGAVRRPHGVRGEVLVEVLTDVAGRFEPGSVLSAAGRSLRVASARPHRDLLLVRFEGLEDRDAVEPLRGLELEAEPRIEPGEENLFQYQLLGCRCTDRLGGPLGEVVELVEDGGGLLLIVEGDGRRLPVPFVRRFVARIDVEAKRIDLDLPPGLIELCASKS